MIRLIIRKPITIYIFCFFAFATVIISDISAPKKDLYQTFMKSYNM